MPERTIYTCDKLADTLQRGQPCNREVTPDSIAVNVMIDGKTLTRFFCSQRHVNYWLSRLRFGIVSLSASEPINFDVDAPRGPTIEGADSPLLIGKSGKQDIRMVGVMPNGEPE